MQRGIWGCADIVVTLANLMKVDMEKLLLNT
jgi:hypothetical protein